MTHMQANAIKKCNLVRGNNISIILIHYWKFCIATVLYTQAYMCSDSHFIAL